MDNTQILLFLKRIHLHLSKGGLSIGPSEALTRAAFTGSFTLSFNHTGMCTLVSDLKHRWKAENSRLYTLFPQSAKDICPQLQQISLDTIVS
jgi:hypothetical protein